MAMAKGKIASSFKIPSIEARVFLLALFYHAARQ